MPQVPKIGFQIFAQCADPRFCAHPTQGPEGIESAWARNVLSLCSLYHIMQALCNHMLTPEQHYDELALPHFGDAQSNGLDPNCKELAF